MDEIGARSFSTTSKSNLKLEVKGSNLKKTSNFEEHFFWGNIYDLWRLFPRPKHTDDKIAVFSSKNSFRSSNNTQLKKLSIVDPLKVLFLMRFHFISQCVGDSFNYKISEGFQLKNESELNPHLFCSIFGTRSKSRNTEKEEKYQPLKTKAWKGGDKSELAYWRNAM